MRATQLSEHPTNVTRCAARPRAFETCLRCANDFGTCRPLCQPGAVARTYSSESESSSRRLQLADRVAAQSYAYAGVDHQARCTRRLAKRPDRFRFVPSF